jgi:transposase
VSADPLNNLTPGGWYRMGETEGKRPNIVGIDPHKRTLSAAIVDERGGIVGVEHFKVSGHGHRALEAWARSFGPVMRWGIEGATGLGRHTTMFLTGRDHDVRDVCPNRTAAAGRGRHQGKSDTLDCERIARETLAHTDVPIAFKRAGDDRGPDETAELLALWHKARRSLVKSRQHLLNEAESLLQELPDDLRGVLPDTEAVRPRLAAVTRSTARPPCPAATTLRVTLLEAYRKDILELDRREREITKELGVLVARTRSTLSKLTGLDTRSVAELLVEVGDPRRFTEGGFGRFSGTAPLPASSGEGPREPVRHRLNRGGNRSVNAVIHRMAVTQLRCEPRAQRIREEARRHGHTKREAMRILKRHLAAAIHRHMIRDLRSPAPDVAA